MLYAIVGLLVVIVDQWVKYWVSGAINPESTGEAFIPGILSLVNVHNDGAAFSFLAGSNARIPFIIITGVFIVAVILALATNFISGRFARWCLVLVTAGGLGNCIDRVIYGYVQDMFKCELFNFPIFNVADVFITVFAILFALAVLFERKTVYDDYEDDALYEEEEEDEEDSRAARRALKAQQREERRAARAAAKASVQEEEDEEDVSAPRPVRKSRKERAEEDYREAQAAQEAPVSRRRRTVDAPAPQAAPTAAPQAVPADQGSDPFAAWERANAQAGVQPPSRPARSQAATPARPAAPAAPRAEALAKPAARPATPAKPVVADEDFSLDDILAEFK